MKVISKPILLPKCNQEVLLTNVNANKQVLLSNPKIEKRLSTDVWRAEKRIYPVRIGLMGIYAPPGISFLEFNRKDNGKYFVYADPTSGVVRRIELPKTVICNGEEIQVAAARDIMLYLKHGFVDGTPKISFQFKKSENQFLYFAEPLFFFATSIPQKTGWRKKMNPHKLPTGSESSIDDMKAGFWLRVDSFFGFLPRGLCCMYRKLAGKKFFYPSDELHALVEPAKGCKRLISL